MKKWAIFFRIMILIIGVIAIAFDVLLYNFCRNQKVQTDAIIKQQQVDARVNDNKFKYQQEQTERISQGLEGAVQKINDQKDALADQKNAMVQEAEKRQQVENESKSIQTSLVDIKAEADAIKQDMKGWQKDYVSVLAELEKKVDDTKGEINNVKNNLDSLNIPELKDNIKSMKTDIEKFTHPSDNSISSTSPEPDKK